MVLVVVPKEELRAEVAGVLLGPSRSGKSAAVDVAWIGWDVQARRDCTLAFESTNETSDDFGDRLSYQVDGPFASIVFHDSATESDWDITWNEDTGTGSLKVPDYHDGARACWDEQQNDIECPDPALQKTGLASGASSGRRRGQLP
jgi:hypothetical protein